MKYLNFLVIVSEPTPQSSEVNSQEENDETMKEESVDSEKPSKPTAAPPPLPRTRPKLGKNKKGKYDDWDDEDRELMMQFMGAGGEKKTRTEKRAQHKERLAAKRSKKVSQMGRANNPKDQETNIEEVISKIKGGAAKIVKNNGIHFCLRYHGFFLFNGMLVRFGSFYFNLCQGSFQPICRFSYLQSVCSHQM